MDRVNNVSHHTQSKDQRSCTVGDICWPRPRSISINKHAQGFGFNLRHFVVFPPSQFSQGQSFQQEGPESSQQTDKPGDSLDTIFVKKVKDGGPACLSGLCTGDRILAVNGDNVNGRSFEQVISVIQHSADPLQLLVVPKDEDLLQTIYQSSLGSHNRSPQIYQSSLGSHNRSPQKSSRLECLHHKRAETRRRFFSELGDVNINNNNNNRPQSRSSPYITYDSLSFDPPGSSCQRSARGELNVTFSDATFSETTFQNFHDSGRDDFDSYPRLSGIHSSSPSLRTPAVSPMPNYGLHYSSPSQNELTNMERRSRLSQRNESRKAALAQYVEDANTFAPRPNESYAISGHQRPEASVSPEIIDNIGSEHNRYARSQTTPSLPYQNRYADTKSDWRSSRSMSGSIGDTSSYQTSRSNRPTAPYSSSTTPRDNASSSYARSAGNLSRYPATSMTSPAAYTPSPVRELSRHSTGLSHLQRTTSDDVPSRRRYVSVTSPIAPREYTRASTYSPRSPASLADPSLGVISPTSVHHQRRYDDTPPSSSLESINDRNKPYTLELDRVKSYTKIPVQETPGRTVDTVDPSAVQPQNIPINVQHESPMEVSESKSPLPLSDVSQNIINSQTESRFQSPKRNSGQFQISDASGGQMFIVSPPERDTKPVPLMPRERPVKVLPKAIVKPSDPSPFGTAFTRAPNRKSSSTSTFPNMVRQNNDLSSNTPFISPEKREGIFPEDTRARKTLDFRQSRPLSDTSINHKVSIEVSRESDVHRKHSVPVSKSDNFLPDHRHRKRPLSASLSSTAIVASQEQVISPCPTNTADDRDQSPVLRKTAIDLPVGNAPTVTQPSVLKRLPTSPLADRTPLKRSSTTDVIRKPYCEEVAARKALPGYLFSQKPAVSVSPRSSNSSNSSKMIMYLSSASSPISKSLTSLVSFKTPLEALGSRPGDCSATEARHSICDAPVYVTVAETGEKDDLDTPAPQFTHSTPGSPPLATSAGPSMSLEMSPSRSSVIHYPSHNVPPPPPLPVQPVDVSAHPVVSDVSVRVVPAPLAPPTIVVHARPVISPLNQPSQTPGGQTVPSGQAVTMTINGQSNVATIQPVVQPVVLRKKLSDAEEELLKFHRRTSYLMATSKERSNLSPPRDIVQPASVTQPASHPIISFEMVQTPPKDINKNKLKQFFGEKTPSILAATDMRNQPQKSPTPIPEISREAYLMCKVAICDGKRASDRSWKVVWAMLRGHLLYMLKEKKDISVSTPLLVEEQPVSIKSCLVDIANDYTKKRHVFRLKTYNGSEYLLQAEDAQSMAAWIEAIQRNNDPDGDESGVIMSDLIARKTNQYDQQNVQPSKTSPQTTQKHQKRSGLLNKAKMSYSPSMRRKKLHADEPKSKEPKTWKGKLGISLKRFGLSAVTVVEEEPAPCSGTFGVPLEHCQPSPDNENVPLIVEICTKIVEIKGMEMVGIYRVPGNIAAVMSMIDELNLGVENMDSDNDKWFDLNVIGSLLKAFFRKLPEPLVTEHLYESFIAANRITQPMKRMLSLKRLFHELPDHHFETLHHIAVHLSRVAACEHKNKMDAKNLAIVFGPTLVRRKHEDACGMVADMSDQCRIVETIILNHDWFFSSWDVDSYVPTPGDDPSQHRLSVNSIPIEDEYDREVDTRTIVISIIQAANRKVRDKEKMSLSCDNLGDESLGCQVNERDIDTEVAKRKAKSHETLHRECLSAVELNCSLPAGKGMDVAHRSYGDFSMSSKSHLTDSYQSLPSTPDWSVLNGASFAASDRDLSGYASTDLSRENDELRISHGSVSSLGGQDTLLRLKRIEEEARALREREERRQEEREKRRIEQLRIEQELQRTRREIEWDEAQGVDDLIRHTQLAKHSAPCPSDQGTHDITDCDVVNTNARSTYLVGDVVSPRPATPRSSSGPAAKPPLKHTPLIVSEHLGQRSSSLEALTPLKLKKHHVSSANRNDNNTLSPPVEDCGGRRLSSRRSSRRSSLDSLRDFYDKDRRKSWASSDSEDGSDLLTSLTTTFDQKLQILLNPKYKLTGARRNSRSDESFSGSSRTDTSSQDGDRAVDKRPPTRVLFNKTTPQLATDGAYRDPSLHRMYRPEAKIGIASRFERGSSTPFTPTCVQLPAMLVNTQPCLESRTPNVKFVAPLQLSDPGRDDDDCPQRPLKSCGQNSADDAYDVVTPSNSPPLCDRSLKRARRRHTVGGVRDVEHMQALEQQSFKPSAWEQLRPAVKVHSIENTSLVHWLHNERLRMSHTHLPSQLCQTLSSSCGNIARLNRDVV